MQNINEEKEVAKERIIKVSEQLFSKKGFDATRVDEIAEAANVNKALIYYYFKSKEHILDYLIQSLFDKVESIALDFIHRSIVQMIKEGRLDIEPDRLHFTDGEAMAYFLQNVRGYYERATDFMLEHRNIIRILMFESLKNSKYHNGLFRFVELAKKTDDNPIYRTIWEADKDYTYSNDEVMFKFFYGIIPLVSFAAYFDDYRRISSLSEEELRSSFLRSFSAISIPFISGNDILLCGEKSTKD